MKKVSSPQVVSTSEASGVAAACGDSGRARRACRSREGGIARPVGRGRADGVVHQLMELEVDEVVGPKRKQDPERTAKRHGHEGGSMTLGGRRVEVRGLGSGPLMIARAAGLKVCVLR